MATLEQRVLNLLKVGQNITAIKLLKDEKQISLRDAKDEVEALIIKNFQK